MKLFTKTNQTSKLFTKVGNVGNKMFLKSDQPSKVSTYNVGRFIANKTNDLEKAIK